MSLQLVDKDKNIHVLQYLSTSTIIAHVHCLLSLLLWYDFLYCICTLFLNNVALFYFSIFQCFSIKFYFDFYLSFWQTHFFMLRVINSLLKSNSEITWRKYVLKINFKIHLKLVNSISTISSSSSSSSFIIYFFNTHLSQMLFLLLSFNFHQLNLVIFHNWTLNRLSLLC